MFDVFEFCVPSVGSRYNKNLNDITFINTNAYSEYVIFDELNGKMWLNSFNSVGFLYNFRTRAECIVFTVYTRKLLKQRMYSIVMYQEVIICCFVGHDIQL